MHGRFTRLQKKKKAVVCSLKTAAVVCCIKKCAKKSALRKADRVCSEQKRLLLALASLSFFFPLLFVARRLSFLLARTAAALATVATVAAVAARTKNVRVRALFNRQKAAAF